jgi:thiol-disulfide isomerase/thioredoxin
MSRVVIPAVAVSALLVWYVGIPASADARQQSSLVDIEYEAALNDGELALADRRFDEAVEAFTEANARQAGRSARALYGLCRSYNGLGTYDKAASACQEGLEHAGDDTRLAARLRAERGLALANQTGGLAILDATENDMNLLHAALDELRASVQLTDDIPEAFFNLGAVALRLGRDGEGLAALEKYLESNPLGPEAGTARELIASPRRIREGVAPDFTIQTVDHGEISLRSLRGRTVLLDFWATWCPPCVYSMPALVRLQQKYGDEPFSIIGINGDRRRTAIEVGEFARSFGANWPQHMDAAGGLGDRYQIAYLPSYVLIDPQGIVALRLFGFEVNTEQRLDMEIRKIIDRAAAVLGR